MIGFSLKRNNNIWGFALITFRKFILMMVFMYRMGMQEYGKFMIFCVEEEEQWKSILGKLFSSPQFAIKSFWLKFRYKNVRRSSNRIYQLKTKIFTWCKSRIPMKVKRFYWLVHLHTTHNKIFQHLICVKIQSFINLLYRNYQNSFSIHLYL